MEKYLIIPFLVFAISITLIILIKSIKHDTEKFYGQLGLQPSMIIPIPPNANSNPYGYIDYGDEQFLKWVCPSKQGEISCKTYKDCGIGEVCINSAGYFAPLNGSEPYPQYNRCTCSISNACITDGVC